MSSLSGEIPLKDQALTQGTNLVDVDGLRDGVAHRLSTVLDDARATFHSISPDADQLIDSWEVLIGGGKRLRAAFAYWGYRTIAGSEPMDEKTREALFQVGAALELFQAAALFHDDVMDRSDTRRGNPTAHRAFEAIHTTSGYVGDGTQYGTNTAILLGDLSLVASEAEFRRATSHFPVACATKAHDYFDSMRTTVTVGQFLDVHAQVVPWSTDLGSARDRALKIIETKTSSYSVTLPLLIGAALAGGTDVQLEGLRNYGLPVGIAYQLFDDILGAFGDSETTGKPTGDDLREGKRTVLVIEALIHLGEEDRELLTSSLGNHDLSNEEVDHLLSLIKTSGAITRTSEMIEQLAQRGLAHLENPMFTTVGTEMLKRITAYSLNRQF